MRRILRVGMIVASLAGLAGTLAPTPAEAQTVGSVTFTGSASVSSHGIAYPLVGSTTGDVDPNKTPTSLHNSATVGFSSGPCVAEGVSTKKALPVEAGTCSITAGGTVHGYCGLSTGQVSGTVSVAIPLSGSQHYSFHVSWVAVGGDLVVTGSVHKHGTPHSGTIEGLVHAAPDTLGVGGGGGGSCLNKLHKHFLVTGEVALEMISGV